MAINFYLLKKWAKMVFGRSILHVEQKEGHNYSFESIKGYYNDLSNKILKDKKHYQNIEPYKMPSEKGDLIYFPIAIFQNGLAAYELILKKYDIKLMEKKFFSHLSWAAQNQQEDGSWNCFGYDHPNAPYSAMAQSEGASLLIRGYLYTKNVDYLKKAIKAIDFMLKPVSNGGTAQYIGEKLILLEFTCYKEVYNGWIFSIFGLIDVNIITKNKYEKALNNALLCFEESLPKIDTGKWSLYRADGIISSRFYHKLIIEQLKVLYKLTKKQIYLEYIERFQRYDKHMMKRISAFFKKGYQKIREK